MRGDQKPPLGPDSEPESDLEIDGGGDSAAGSHQPTSEPPSVVTLATTSKATGAVPPRANLSGFGKAIGAAPPRANLSGFGQSMLAGPAPKPAHDFDKQYAACRIEGQSPTPINNALDALEELLQKHGLCEFRERSHDGKVIFCNSYELRGIEAEAAAHEMTVKEFEMQSTVVLKPIDNRAGRPFRMAKVMASLARDALFLAPDTQKPMSDCKS